MPTENLFLQQKYPDLPGSKPVKAAVDKARRSGKKIHDNPERVAAYMDRLEGVTQNERGFGKLKAMVLNRFAIDTRDEEDLDRIAQGLYESEKRIATEQGRGRGIEQLEAKGDITRRYRPLILEKADIQRRTLSSWLDYLQKNDAKQPMWFRYFVVRSLEKMGILDKEKVTYSKRTPSTIAPFPELNSETLGWVYRRLNEGVDPDDYKLDEEERERLAPAEQTEQQAALDKKKQQLERLIQAKDFAKLYAFAQLETAGKLNRESIEGEWKKYDQGSDHRLLEKHLKGKGTGWCTAEGSAANQLQAGDFFVYYSKGSGKGYTEPRVAIRMEGDHVAEVRGVNPRQELEPELVDIAQKQYHNLPGGESYDKKARDMKEVTRLVQAQEKGQPFSKADLRFLYELDAPIEGFGYEQDPRIEELKSKRNNRADFALIFDCTEEELEQKEHVTLRDIPSFSKLPSEADIKKGFKFDSIWGSEYRKDRPLTDFALTEKDFERIGLGEAVKASIVKAIKTARADHTAPEEDDTDVDLRKIGFKKDELARARAALKETKESSPEAKVFDIGDAIRKKKQADPSHPNYLSTKEVLEAIDEAGYRPATIQELLAYGRDHWKPDADPTALSDEEKLLQRANAPYIYALASPFSNSDGYR